MGTEITAIATAVGSMIVSLFQSLAAIFYTPATTDTAGSFTIFGYLLLFSAMVGLVLFVINWIKGIITVRKN